MLAPIAVCGWVHSSLSSQYLELELDMGVLEFKEAMKAPLFQFAPLAFLLAHLLLTCLEQEEPMFLS